ncbi:MAG: hypothetical protein EOO20_27105, partial [Chryseobacterium sp.]
MKRYTYLIFFILLSGISFGQDRLLIEKLKDHGPVRGLNLDSFQSALKNQRDDARIIIDTVSVIAQTSRGNSGYENLNLLVKKHNAISKDTIYLYVNEYQLTKAAVDSVWQSVFSSAQTQGLLKDYLGKKHPAIFLPENYVNLISIFKSKHTSYKTKQHLLVDKIRFDDQNIKKVNNVTPNYATSPDGSYQPPPWRAPMLPEQVYPYLITIPFQSKEQVVADYLKIISRSQSGNFAAATILYVKASYRKKQLYLKRAKISKYSALSTKSARSISRTNIIDIDFYPPLVGRALFSDKGKNGLVVI